MTQKHFRTGAEAPCPNNNISMPIGLVDTVSHYLDITGISDFLSTRRSKGVPLPNIVKAMCVYSMYEDNSLTAMAKWLEDVNVRRMFELDKCDVSQRTLNRALAELGKCRESIIETLWKGIVDHFGITDTDVFTDGSAVRRESDYGDRTGIGYPRDKNPDGLQTEFTVASLSDSRIPFYIKTFDGNVSDEQQYAECLPEMLGLIDKGKLNAYKGLYTEWKSPAERGDREIPSPMPKGDERSFADLVSGIGEASWVILDNGGASNYNTTLIALLGHHYLTRKELNATDMKNILQGNIGEEIEPGLWCLKHTFLSSGRTSYLFFSQDLKDKKVKTTERRIRRQVKIANDVADGHIEKSKIFTIKKNPFLDVSIKFNVQSRIAEYTEEDIQGLISKGTGPSCGFFKLESSKDIPPLTAIRMYRKRAIIEQLISSLKNNTGIKPMRVWSDDSVCGSMMLSLLCEFSVAAARYELPKNPVDEKQKIEVTEDVSLDLEQESIETAPFSSQDGKPSTKSLIRSLTHLTVTFVISGNKVKDAIYSNWDDVSKRIYANFQHKGDPLIR